MRQVQDNGGLRRRRPLLTKLLAEYDGLRAKAFGAAPDSNVLSYERTASLRLLVCLLVSHKSLMEFLKI